MSSCVYSFFVRCFSFFCGYGLQGSTPTEPFVLKRAINPPHTPAGQSYVVVFKLPFRALVVPLFTQGVALG